MDSTIASLLRLATNRTILVEAERSWTVGELVSATGSAARGLRQAGIVAGSRVGVVARSSAETVAVLLGARSLGAIVCPVDPRDARNALDVIHPALVVSSTPVEGHRTVSPTHLLGGPAGLDPVSGDVAWGMPTSGSSGRIKIVMLTESSVAFVTGAVAPLVAYSPDDRVLCALPLHHTYGLSQLWLALSSGAQLLLPPAQLLPGDLIEWATTATVIPGIPATFRVLRGGPPLAALRLATLAGQATRPADRRSFATAFPGTSFIHFYGMTEATTRILWLPPDAFVAAIESTGVPLPGTRAALADDGELLTEGPHIAAGYLDDPAASRDRFPGPGSLRTGDLFIRDSSDMFQFQGRKDGTFKRMGEKVIPEVVEAALEQHESVARVLVTGEPSRDGEPEPVAWVVPAGTAPTPGSLIKWLRPLVPPAMLPARIVFVERLATTANNKLIRKRPA